MEKVEAARMVTGTNEQEGGQFVPVPSCRSHTYGERQFDRVNAATRSSDTTLPDPIVMAPHVAVCFPIAVFFILVARDETKHFSSMKGRGNKSVRRKFYLTAAMNYLCIFYR